MLKVRREGGFAVYHKTLFRFYLPVVLFSLSCSCLAQNHSAAFSSIAGQSVDIPFRQAIAEDVLRLGLKGEYLQALDALSRAQQAAEKNSDKPGIAMVIIDRTL